MTSTGILSSTTVSSSKSATSSVSHHSGGLWTVRSKTAIKNHLFAALCGYIQLQKLSAMALIKNCYSVQRNLFNGVIAGFSVI